jgi:sugar/nucleoside kinase (ribokinase family)
MKSHIELAAVGDVVTDAFIRLEDAHKHCNLDKIACELCVEFGSKIPYESVHVVHAVGNAANAAIAASRLGVFSAIVSNIGDDDVGKEHIKVFKQEKVSTNHLKVHWKMRTNYHYVLWFEDDRTILVKHEAYPYKMSSIGTPKWLYLTSLASTSLGYHKEIESYLRMFPEVKLAFQPGTFQINLGREKMAYLYKRSNIFFCNKEEAQKILGVREKNLVHLMKMMAKLGPKLVVITDGPHGAYFYDGITSWHMPPYPDPKPPFERTGAGDAFSSTFVTALALGESIEEAMKWAPINAMSVVQKIGARAGLLNREELEHWLDKAPLSYKPKKIK